METLSKREMQVADLVHQGFIEKEIADEMCVSYETVRTHTKNIRKKLHARNAADITRIFLLELKPYAIALIIAVIAYIVFNRNPELLENLKASFSHFFK